MKSAFKIFLCNPPYLPRFSRSQRSPGVIRSGTMYYPYWLAHATAVLQKEGFSCFLMDCPAANQSLDDLLIKLKEENYSLVVLETSTASYENDLRVAKEIRHHFPSVKICLTGTHATAVWKDCLEKSPWVDFVAIGEYDYILRDLSLLLCRDVNANSSELSQIAALGFRVNESSAARGPLREPIESVDELPWIAPVYKQFLDVKNYYFSLASYPMVMLIGGRGCVAKCTYCVYPQVMFGHRYRTRSPESIVGEMKWIQENMPEVKEIVFEDDTFTGDKAYAKRVAELVKEKGVNLPWFTNVRCSIDRETLEYMSQAGFRCCAVGFESGDDILLKNMWKGQTVKMQKDFVDNCKDLKILVHGCFMFGFPGETHETMKKTLELALFLNPDSAQFYPVMPFPGTSYYEWAKANGYLATEKFRDWLNGEGKHQCVINLPGLTGIEIEKFCEKAYRRFYFRPKYFIYKIKQALRHPAEGIRSVLSFVYYLIYLITKRKKKNNTITFSSIAHDSDWYRVHSMPKGRMFEQETLLRKNKEERQTLAQLAQAHPHL